MKRSVSMRGFTLIEVMITVVIISILIAFALPSYQESVRQSRRAQAKSDLLEIMQLAERFFTVNNTYVGFVLPPNMIQSPPAPGRRWYDVSLDQHTQTTLRVTAAPVDGQAVDRCGVLTVNHQNRRTHSTGVYAECW